MAKVGFLLTQMQSYVQRRYRKHLEILCKMQIVASISGEEKRIAKVVAPSQWHILNKARFFGCQTTSVAALAKL